MHFIVVFVHMNIIVMTSLLHDVLGIMYTKLHIL